MNLPQLTAKIGRAAKQEIGSASELAMLVRTIFSKKGENAYSIYLTFDIPQQEIRFEDPFPFQQDDPFRFHYFGNNSAAGTQYYLTRDGNSVHYLLKSVLSDLSLVLKKNKMQESELYSVISDLYSNDMISIGSKKGTGAVNLSKIKGITGATIDDKNNIVVEEKKRKGEEFIRFITGYESKDNGFPLIIPRIIAQKSTEPIVLPIHHDYVTLTKMEQNIDNSKSTGEEQFCFICHRTRADVSSKLTSGFSRTGINKLFGTTTINSAKRLEKKFYDDSYAICGDCFQDLLFGEKKVSKDFSTEIAKERAFIIPEGLIDEFDYDDIESLKHGMDLFFNKGYADDIFKDYEQSASVFSNPGYVIHFIINRTDGNSVTVLDTFEDVPTMHIVRIAELMGNHVSKLKPYIRSMSLGTIYRMIPIRTNKKGEQLDVQRVLSVYNALFTKSVLEVNVLFDYAAEALEKGFRELQKKQVQQYFNLGLNDFFPEQENRYFRLVIMRYLCLLQTCKDLEILDRPIFYNKGVRRMNLEGMDERIKQAEQFLDEQSFDELPKALFYLGLLLRGVVQAQWKKNHKSKPVLNKISFQGMNEKEIRWLYQEILEKLHQYKEMKVYHEQLMHAFNQYYGNIREDGSYPLTDQENIFYLMAGYAFSPYRYKDEENQVTDEDNEKKGDESHDNQ